MVIIHYIHKINKIANFIYYVVIIEVKDTSIILLDEVDCRSNDLTTTSLKVESESKKHLNFVLIHY
jgi:hypothetical protein